MLDCNDVIHQFSFCNVCMLERVFRILCLRITELCFSFSLAELTVAKLESNDRSNV